MEVLFLGAASTTAPLAFERFGTLALQNEPYSKTRSKPIGLSTFDKDCKSGTSFQHLLNNCSYKTMFSSRRVIRPSPTRQIHKEQKQVSYSSRKQNKWITHKTHNELPMCCLLQAKWMECTCISLHRTACRSLGTMLRRGKRLTGLHAPFIIFGSWSTTGLQTI